MTESYYRALIRARHARDIQRLLDLLDVAEDVRAIPDAHFIGYMEDQTEGAEDDEADPGDNVLASLDMPAPSVQDLQSLHRTAAAVMRGIPHEMVDIRATWTVSMEGRLVKVHFDNCSHSSGKQRVYVACLSPHHQACFRYSIAERFASAAHAAAYMAAWTAHAAEQPASFTKEDHKRYEPSDDLWTSLLPMVSECQP
jgi:hypothetical protein